VTSKVTVGEAEVRFSEAVEAVKASARKGRKSRSAQPTVMAKPSAAPKSLQSEITKKVWLTLHFQLSLTIRLWLPLFHYDY
jgi:hypothetical protein